MQIWTHIQSFLSWIPTLIPVESDFHYGIKHYLLGRTGSYISVSIVFYVWSCGWQPFRVIPCQAFQFGVSPCTYWPRFAQFCIRVLNPSRTVQPFPDICLSETAINEFFSETWSIWRSTTNLIIWSIIFAFLLIWGVWGANVREGLHCPGRVKDSRVWY